MNKFWVMLFAICASTIIVAFLLSVFQVVDLSVGASSMEIPYTIESALRFAMFTANIALLLWFCLNGSWCDILVCTAVYIPIQYAVDVMLDTSIITSTIVPVVYVLLCGAITRVAIKEFARNVGAFIIVFAFAQWQLVFVRDHVIVWHYTEFEVITSAIILADVFVITYILKKGGLFHAQLVIRERRGRLDDELSIHAEGKRVQQDEANRDALSVADMTRYQRLKFAAMVAGFQLFQLAVVLIIGILNRMFFEVLLMLATFWCLRKILKESWHSDSLLHCSVTAFISFFILSSVSFSFSQSLLMCVCSSAAFTMLMHVVGVKSNRLDALEERYENDFTKYGLSKDMAEFAYSYKVEGKSIKEQMQTTGLSEQVVKNYRTKVNNAIKKYGNVTF